MLNFIFKTKLSLKIIILQLAHYVNAYTFDNVIGPYSQYNYETERTCKYISISRLNCNALHFNSKLKYCNGETIIQHLE